MNMYVVAKSAEHLAVGEWLSVHTEEWQAVRAACEKNAEAYEVAMQVVGAAKKVS